MLGLEVSDHGFDRSTVLELAQNAFERVIPTLGNTGLIEIGHGAMVGVKITISESSSACNAPLRYPEPPSRGRSFDPFIINRDDTAQWIWCSLGHVGSLFAVLVAFSHLHNSCQIWGSQPYTIVRKSVRTPSRHKGD